MDINWKIAGLMVIDSSTSTCFAARSEYWNPVKDFEAEKEEIDDEEVTV